MAPCFCLDLKLNSNDLRAAVRIPSRGIFYRHAPIPEASPSRMKALECAALNAAVGFLCQFLDVKAIDNPVSREQHFCLLGIRVDSLGHKNQAHVGETKLLENAKRIRELTAQTACVIHQHCIKGAQV